MSKRCVYLVNNALKKKVNNKKIIFIGSAMQNILICIDFTEFKVIKKFLQFLVVDIIAINRAFKCIVKENNFYANVKNAILDLI